MPIRPTYIPPWPPTGSPPAVPRLRAPAPITRPRNPHPVPPPLPPPVPPEGAPARRFLWRPTGTKGEAIRSSVKLWPPPPAASSGAPMLAAVRRRKRRRRFRWPS